MRTPERQALADAIAKHSAALRQVPALEQSGERLNDAVWRARRALTAAAEQIEVARGGAKAGAAGASRRPTLSLRDARAAEQDAQDQLEAALAARDELPAQVEQAKSSVIFTEVAVKAAVANVVKADPGLLTLAEECIAFRREYFSRLWALDTMKSRGMLTPEAREAGNVERGLEDRPASPWLAAIEALATDPDAPLPGADAEEEQQGQPIGIGAGGAPEAPSEAAGDAEELGQVDEGEELPPATIADEAKAAA